VHAKVLVQGRAVRDQLNTTVRCDELDLFVLPPPASASSRAVWLMAGGPAVITDNEARDVHRLEVREGETCNALKIGIVPASVGCAD